MSKAANSEVHMFQDGRMTARNAAIYMGFSEKTLAMWRCNGVGPEFIKLGRVFYFKHDIDAWLMEAGKQRSTSQSRLRAPSGAVNSSQAP